MVWWEIYRRFPNQHRSEADRKFEIEHDADENEKIRIDSEEDLLVPIIWATEVFGPSEIDSFYGHMKNLGWSKNPSRTDCGPAKWIAEQRLYGFGGSYNIGVVTRAKSKSFSHIQYFAPLPDEVDYLDVMIRQVSTSVTCVTIGFFLKPVPRTWYREELNRDRKTFRRAIPASRTITILSPENQKHESISKVRAQYRAVATEWFKEHMAGFFSRQGNDNLLPTAELLTCMHTTLLTGLSDARRLHRPRWLHTLLPIGMWEVWTNTSLPALRLTLDEFENESRHHAVFALTTSQVSPEALVPYGGASVESYASYVHNHVNELLAHHATLAYLTEAARIVKRNREKLKPNHKSDKVETALEVIAGFFQESAGFPAVAEDLLKRGASPIWLNACALFVTQDRHGAENRTYTLAEALASRTHGLAQHLSEGESSTREQFEQFASILSIKESVRAQKKTEVLTVLALVVAFLSLLAALQPLSEWRKDLRKWAVEAATLTAALKLPTKQPHSPGTSTPNQLSKH